MIEIEVGGNGITRFHAQDAEERQKAEKTEIHNQKRFRVSLCFKLIRSLNMDKYLCLRDTA